MPRYHVTYFYLATGMEGRPDVDDYGMHDARNAEEARDMAAKARHPNSRPGDIEWVKSCLTARPC